MEWQIHRQQRAEELHGRSSPISEKKKIEKSNMVVVASGNASHLLESVVLLFHLKEATKRKQAPLIIVTIRLIGIECQNISYAQGINPETCSV